MNLMLTVLVADATSFGWLFLEPARLALAGAEDEVLPKGAASRARR